MVRMRQGPHIRCRRIGRMWRIGLMGVLLLKVLTTLRKMLLLLLLLVRPLRLMVLLLPMLWWMLLWLRLLRLLGLVPVYIVARHLVGIVAAGTDTATALSLDESNSIIGDCVAVMVVVGSTHDIGIVIILFVVVIAAPTVVTVRVVARFRTRSIEPRDGVCVRLRVCIRVCIRRRACVCVCPRVRT